VLARPAQGTTRADQAELILGATVLIALLLGGAGHWNIGGLEDGADFVDVLVVDSCGGATER
jgi:hypothetical protein